MCLPTFIIAGWLKELEDNRRVLKQNQLVINSLKENMSSLVSKVELMQQGKPIYVTHSCVGNFVSPSIGVIAYYVQIRSSIK